MKYFNHQTDTCRKLMINAFINNELYFRYILAAIFHQYKRVQIASAWLELTVGLPSCPVSSSVSINVYAKVNVTGVGDNQVCCTLFSLSHYNAKFQIQNSLLLLITIRAFFKRFGKTSLLFKRTCPIEHQPIFFNNLSDVLIFSKQNAPNSTLVAKDVKLKPAVL